MHYCAPCPSCSTWGVSGKLGPARRPGWIVGTVVTTVTAAISSSNTTASAMALFISCTLLGLLTVVQHAACTMHHASAAKLQGGMHAMLYCGTCSAQCIVWTAWHQLAVPACCRPLPGASIAGSGSHCKPYWCTAVLCELLTQQISKAHLELRYCTFPCTTRAMSLRRRPSLTAATICRRSCRMQVCRMQSQRNRTLMCISG